MKVRLGFYWVRFEGELIIAERTTGRGCGPSTGHWHIPGMASCVADSQVCEVLSVVPLRIPRSFYKSAILRDPREATAPPVPPSASSPDCSNPSGTVSSTSPDPAKEEKRGE